MLWRQCGFELWFGHFSVPGDWYGTVLQLDCRYCVWFRLVGAGWWLRYVDSSCGLGVSGWLPDWFWWVSQLDSGGAGGMGAAKVGSVVVELCLLGA